METGLSRSIGKLTIKTEENEPANASTIPSISWVLYQIYQYFIFIAVIQAKWLQFGRKKSLNLVLVAWNNATNAAHAQFTIQINSLFVLGKMIQIDSFCKKNCIVAGLGIVVISYLKTNSVEHF